MEDFVFISDFDGTISRKDFYWHIIDKYMKEEGNKQYQLWRKGEIEDLDFLSSIFNNINREEEEIKEDILTLEIDHTVQEFIKYINDHHGDFIILSAGSSYYIDAILQNLDLTNVTVYSNKAVYKDKGIYFDIDKNYKFYSKRYGLDKKKVVESLKSKYSTLYYAGDSEPDYEASLLCNKRFATGRLIDIYKKNNVDYYSFSSFKEIKKIMEDILVETTD